MNRTAATPTRSAASVGAAALYVDLAPNGLKLSHGAWERLGRPRSVRLAADDFRGEIAIEATSLGDAFFVSPDSWRRQAYLVDCRDFLEEHGLTPHSHRPRNPARWVAAERQIVFCPQRR